LPEKLDDVFELSFTIRPELDGSGRLGLYIARLIANNHGGSAKIEDSLTNVVKLTIELPATK
jgi:signal transduction histidine kinase